MAATTESASLAQPKLTRNKKTKILKPFQLLLT
jgi:hypothetical protein